MCARHSPGWREGTSVCKALTWVEGGYKCVQGTHLGGGRVQVCARHSPGWREGISCTPLCCSSALLMMHTTIHVQPLSPNGKGTHLVCCGNFLATSCGVNGVNSLACGDGLNLE